MTDESDQTSSQYVCMPCREMVPGVPGELTVPGDSTRHGTVWCPWCGDKMEKYEKGVHG
jgi:DNA-directed RNA polymerase subunit RPC12/RpoP